VPFGFKLPDGMVAEDRQRVFVYASNPQILVVGLSVKSQGRSMVLRKHDGAWLVIPERLSPSALRAFGKYVAFMETHTKKTVAAQIKAHPNMVISDRDTREQELSAGRKEWRTEDGPMGPSLVESFANSDSVFPGRLHVFDSDTEAVFTITTNQGDSEILLIDGTVYYRVSDRLYGAPISAKHLGAGHLLAQDEEIRDAHWAFVKH
jgi:hypothetical protein